MQGWIASAVSVALAMAGMGPAIESGQSAGSSASGSPAASSAPTQEAELTLAGYADCLVDRRLWRSNITQFLRTIPYTAAAQQMAGKLIDGDCLMQVAARPLENDSVVMSVQAEALRQSLYPALYRRDYRKAAAPDIGSLSPLTLSSEFDGDLAALPPLYRPIRTLGDCVVRASPVGARSLVLARPYSTADDAAINAIRPALAGCIRQGQTLHLNRSMLRATVGEALYKLSRAASSASARG